MARVLYPRSPTVEAKSIASTDWEDYFDHISDYVISGFNVSDQGGRNVRISSGKARLKGLVVHNTANEDYTITASGTRKLYVKIDRDGNNRPQGWSVGQTSGSLPADSMQIARVVTTSNDISSIRQQEWTDIRRYQGIDIGRGNRNNVTSFPVDKLFWDTSDNNLYRNSGTEASPSWSVMHHFAMNDLSNVNAPNPTTGKILQYTAGSTNKWQLTDLPSGLDYSRIFTTGVKNLTYKPKTVGTLTATRKYITADIGDYIIAVRVTLSSALDMNSAVSAWIGTSGHQILISTNNPAAGNHYFSIHPDDNRPKSTNIFPFANSTNNARIAVGYATVTSTNIAEANKISGIAYATLQDNSGVWI